MDAELLDALERVWHLALSRAEDKDAELPAEDRRSEDPLVIDVCNDGTALTMVQTFIEAQGGRT